MTPHRGRTVRVFGRTGIVRLPTRRGFLALLVGVLPVGILIGVAVGPVAGSGAPAARPVVAISGGHAAAGATTPTTDTSSTTPDSGASSATPDTSGSASTTPATSSGTSTSTSRASSSAGGALSAAGNSSSTDTSGGGATTTDTTSPGTTTTGTSTGTAPTKLSLSGVVVSTNASAQSFALADGQGELHAVHVDKNPKLGSTVKVAPHKLANGTVSSARVVKSKGAAKTSAPVTGVVTFVDQPHARYALSAPGVSLLIHMATAGGSLPVLGHKLKATLSVPAAGGTVPAGGAPHEESGHTDLGVAAPKLDLAGVILTVDTAGRTITVSADGPGLSDAKLTLTAPSSFDLARVSATEAIVGHATVDTTGSYTLTGVASDNGASLADDQSYALGDFKSKSHNARHHRRRGVLSSLALWIP